MGKYQDIHAHNRNVTGNYDERILSYVRWSDEEQLIVISNFDAEKSYEFELKVPDNIIAEWKLNKGSYELVDQLYNTYKTNLDVGQGDGSVKLKLAPLQSYILKLKK
jgi:hypothetical protein